MNIFALSGFINGLAGIAFGVFIYLKGPKRLTNKIFGLLTLFFSLWAFSYGFWLVSQEKEVAFFWVRLLTVGSTFIPITFLHWILILLKKDKKRKCFIFLGYLLSLSFLIFIFSPLCIRDLEPTLSFLWWPKAGIIYTVYIILGYFGLIGYAIYELLVSYLKSHGFLHEQIKYIFLAVLAGFGGGATNYPLWYDIPILPYGNLFVFLYPLILSYAVTRYRLMDIRLILGKSAVYLFSLLSVIGLSFFLAFLNGFFPGGGLSFNILGPLIIVLTILLFQPFFRFYEKIAAKYFYYTFYSYQKVLNDLSSKLTRILDLRKLSDLIAHTLIETMRLERTVILLRKETGHYTILKNIGFKEENGISLVQDNFLTEYLQRTGKPLVYEELSLIKKDSVLREEKENLTRLQENMKRIEANLCLPLFREDNIIGMIVLGRKMSSDPYSKEDLNLLAVLASQASIALENAKLYSQVEDLSENLQLKVDQQTKELKKAYQKIKKAYQVEKKAHQELKKLDEAKTQFIMATQHHLRTPLTIMKGYVSMILEGDYGKINNKVKKKLNFFKEFTERLIRLVNDFLDISQFQVGKSILKLTKLKPIDIALEVIEELRPEAEEKGLYLKLKKTQSLPQIKGDKAKLREALYNVVNNGLKYTQEGGVEIELIKNKHLEIVVRDTGIGMTQHQSKNLFNQIFERGEKAKAVYALGKGIGLYISSKIVEAHGGKIWAESPGEDQGSVFHLVLPIK